MTAIGDDPKAQAIALVLELEGGKSFPHPGDRNPTNRGITLATAIAEFKRGLVDFDTDDDGEVTASDVYAMQEVTARQFYGLLWKRAKCDEMCAADAPMTATVHFDSSVQHRVYARLFQEAIGCREAGLRVDGLIGERTLDLLVHMVKHHGDEAMAVALIRRRIAYYKTLAVYPENKHGWRRRINLLCAALMIPPLWSAPV